MLTTTVFATLLLVASGRSGDVLSLRDRIAAVRLENIQDFNLVSFTWSNATSTLELLVCGDIDLVGADDVSNLEYTLVYGSNQTIEVNVAGVADTSNKKCSLFGMNRYQMAGVAEWYKLYVVESGTQEAKHGRAQFVMTTPGDYYKVTPINTSLPLYRVSSDPPRSFDGLQCLESEATLSSSVCYTSSVGTGPACINVSTTEPDGNVKVCQELLSDSETDLPAEELTIESLAYVDGEPTVGVLTLNFAAAAGAAKALEAVVYTDGASPYVYDCSVDNKCNLANFARGSARYHVQAVAFTDGEPAFSGQSAIEDLNIFVFQDDPMIEFGFTKTGSAGTYRAFFEGSDPPTSATIDCTAMRDDHTCFGFLQMSNPAQESVAVSIQFANGGSNTVVAPYVVVAAAPAAQRRKQDL